MCYSFYSFTVVISNYVHPRTCGCNVTPRNVTGLSRFVITHVVDSLPFSKPFPLQNNSGNCLDVVRINALLSIIPVVFVHG